MANFAKSFQNNVILSVSEVSKQKRFSPQNDGLLIVSLEFAYKSLI